MLNIQPDSCLITSSDTGMKEYIHIRNEKRIFSSLSPEGENWAGVREPGANFLYIKKKMFAQEPSQEPVKGENHDLAFTNT